MSVMPTTELNLLAQKFRALHVPGNPVLLANVYDAITARNTASDPACKAIATASWAIAAVQGEDDDDMTFEQNIQGVRNVVKGIANAGKTHTMPLSLDLQDGYADIKYTIKTAITLGAVGANIEDVDLSIRKMRSIGDATNRIKLAMEAATEAGVPDFVVNARTDVLAFGGDINDVTERSAAYVAAGAVTAFVWGTRVKDLTLEEVTNISKQLNGKISVHGPGPAKLSIEQLREANVSRISMGPWFLRQAMETFDQGAKELLNS